MEIRMGHERSFQRSAEHIAAELILPDDQGNHSKTDK